MIAQFSAWLFGLFKSVFVALWNIITDLFIAVSEIVFMALSAAINAIPAPAFLSQNSLGGLLNQMPDYVLYFVGSMKLSECFAVIGAGFAFRMTRKIFTLGQW